MELQERSKRTGDVHKVYCVSPSLWNLVVDDLLWTLNEQSMYTQGYVLPFSLEVKCLEMDSTGKKGIQVSRTDLNYIMMHMGALTQHITLVIHHGHKSDGGVWLISIMAKSSIGPTVSLLGVERHTCCYGKCAKPPLLGIIFVGEAMMAAYLLQCNGNWHSHHSSKHTKISDISKLDTLQMMADRMSKVIMNWEKTMTSQHC
ncbi:hypothetical protein J6590_005968 [Homalodisca vitripennis]|nr:hypothetical protein J6590_005968 [Homalodisca vitripennis]